MEYYETQDFIHAFERVCNKYQLKDIELPKDLSKKVHDRGLTIAHLVVYYNYNFPLDSELLTLRDNTGWTVAHVMVVRKGYIFPEDHPILYEKNNDGWSVAHAMPCNGYCFPEDHPVLNEKDNNRNSVLDAFLVNSSDITQ